MKKIKRKYVATIEKALGKGAKGNKLLGGDEAEEVKHKHTHSHKSGRQTEQKNKTKCKVFVRK